MAERSARALATLERIARALETPVTDVMDARAPAVHEGSPLDSVTAVLVAEGVSAAPVVDRQGRFVGVVSFSDIAREGAPGDVQLVQSGLAGSADEDGGVLGPGQSDPLDPSDRLTARDVMSRVACALPVGATIRQATDTLESDQDDCLPVVGAGGEVLGVLRARDVVRWFAQLVRPS